MMERKKGKNRVEQGKKERGVQAGKKEAEGARGKFLKERKGADIC
jgi:hypothetical protein